MDEDIIEVQEEIKDVWVEFIYHDIMGISAEVSNGGRGRLIDGDSYRLRWREDRDFIGIYGRVWVDERDGSGQMADVHSHGWILSRIDATERDIVKIILSTKVRWMKLK